MTLDEAYKIKDSLKELSADVETFNWGPSWEFANQRKAEALRIIEREIKRSKAAARENHVMNLGQITTHGIKENT